MPDNFLMDAATQALRAVKAGTMDVSMGPPPGVEAVPWKDQAAQFLSDLPDLMAHGPRYQDLAKRYGEPEVQKYMQTMHQQILKGRQRRRPL